MFTTSSLANFRLTVFKGGTAFNSLLTDFQAAFPHTTYIVPITDDGGSSREIKRVFGGPSIGDLRSTLTRLSNESTPEACAVKKLLEYRLPCDDLAKAQTEWQALLEGRHLLYHSISSKYRELIRCFLCKFEAERLHRISYCFDICNGSVGNFFFSGARMFLGSLETAIFMYSSVARISPVTHVLPIIDSNDCLGIGVKLANQEVVIGQHMISHPSDHGRVDKNLCYAPLSAPIKELFYVDKFRNLIQPKPHSEVLNQIKWSHGVIYGIGSLWTSIIPCLVLEGIGEAIASLKGPKIALLNCCHDRETDHMSALDYIDSMTNSLNRYGVLSHSPQAYITHLFIVDDCSISVEEKQIKQMGIQVNIIAADSAIKLSIQNQTHPVYASHALIQSIFDVLNRE